MSMMSFFRQLSLRFLMLAEVPNLYFLSTASDEKFASPLLTALIKFICLAVRESIRLQNSRFSWPIMPLNASFTISLVQMSLVTPQM